MPTIVQAMKKLGGEYRVADRGLSWDRELGTWKVLQLGQKEPVCLTPDQRTAVDFLLGKR